MSSVVPAFSNVDEACSWFAQAVALARRDIKASEALLLPFRSSLFAVETAVRVIERSQEGHELFFAIQTLQHALVARWDTMGAADRASMRELARKVCVERVPRMERFVRPSAVRLLCVLYKISWADDAASRREFFERLPPDAGAYKALVSEFQGYSAIGAPLELHIGARKAFQQDGLHHVLLFGFAELGRLLGGTAADAEQLQLCAELCTECLSWDFDAATRIESTPLPERGSVLVNVPKGFAKAFHDALVRPEILTSTINAYLSHRSSGSVAHALRQLLILLASLGPSLFEGEAERVSYCDFLLQGVAAILDAPISGDAAVKALAPEDAEEAFGNELVDILTLLLRALGNFGVGAVVPLPRARAILRGAAELMRNLLQQSTELYEGAFRRGGGGDLDLEFSYRMEALDLCMDMYARLMYRLSSLHYSAAAQPLGEAQQAEYAALDALLSEGAATVFPGFVRFRLAAARCEGAWSADDEDGEDVGDARVTEQIEAACQIGRHRPAENLRSLTALCADLGGAYDALLRSGGAALDARALGLLDELRTAVLIMGHFLADDFEGEVALIPLPFGRALEGPQAQDMASALLEACSFLLRLARAVTEAAARDSGAAALSPYVLEAIAYACARFGATYLLTENDALYAQDSPRGAEAYGCLAALAFRLLLALPAEEQLQRSAALLVRVLHLDRRQRLFAARVPVFADIFSGFLAFLDRREDTRSRMAARRDFFHLPAPSLAAAARYLAAASAAAGGTAAQDLVRSLSRRCADVAGGIAARDGGVLAEEEVERLATLLGGAVRGFAEDGAAEALCGALAEGFLPGFVAPLKALPNSERCLVAVFDGLNDFCAATPQLSGALLDGVLVRCVREALAAFEMQRTGRAQRIASSEERTDVLLAAVRCLSQMSGRDLLGGAGGAGGADALRDCLLLGLAAVVPLMGEEQLLGPRLAEAFFQLCEYVVEAYVSAVSATFAPPLYQALWRTLLRGVAAGTQASARSAGYAMTELARDVLVRTPGAAGQLASKPDLLLEPMQALLALLTESNGVAKVDGLASLLYMLASAGPDAFAALGARAVDGQGSQAKRDRMRQAFAALTAADGLRMGVWDAANRRVFKGNLRRFVVDVRSFTTIA